MAAAQKYEIDQIILAIPTLTTKARRDILTICKESGCELLSVPGIYQRQERVMAVIFGFPEFIPVISEEEKDEKGEPINRFGCWFRYIEEL